MKGTPAPPNHHTLVMDCSLVLVRTILLHRYKYWLKERYTIGNVITLVITIGQNTFSHIMLCR